jgi:ferritin
MKTFCVGIDSVSTEFFHVQAETEEEAREKLLSHIRSEQIGVEWHTVNDADFDRESVRIVEDCASLEEPS